MNPLLELAASLIFGAVIGLLFFWSLWRSVNTLDRAEHLALKLLGGLLARFVLVLAAFYFLTRHGGWQHLLAATVGFTLVRLIMVQRIGFGPDMREQDKKEQKT